MKISAHQCRRLIAACVVVLALGGCAAEPEVSGRYPDLSLRQSKNSAQLLRNEVASRIPSDVVAEFGESIDESVACLPEKEDADGTIRSWQSTATVALTDAAASTVDTVIDTLAATFTEQGWVLASLEGSSIIHTRYLSRDKTTAIDLGATSDDEDAIYVPSTDLATANVVIVVHGPCVVTDGAKSDEVAALEKRSPEAVTGE